MLRGTVLAGSALGAGALLSACGARESEPVGTPAVNISPGGSPDGVSPSATSVLPDNLTVSPSASPEAAGVTEFVNSERAILDLGNMEVAVVGWEETKLTTDVLNVNPADYKMVLVQTIWRNKSDVFLSRRLVEDSGDYYRFYVGEERKYWGFSRTYQYLDWGGANNVPYVANGFSQTSFEDFPANVWIGDQVSNIPPGFGIPMGILADVPKNEQNYGFIVDPKQQGLPNPSGITRGEKGVIIIDPEKFIRRGEIAADFGLISEDVESKQVGEEAVLEDYMSVKLVNAHDSATSTGKRTNNLLFTVTNISKDYLSNPSRNMEILVYLADGRVVPYLDLMNLGDDYPAPGETQSYDFMVGIEKPPQGYETFAWPFYQLYDLAGAKVLFMAYNRWGLWQLP